MKNLNMRKHTYIVMFSLHEQLIDECRDSSRVQ